jgi:hypothetical protein
MVPKGLPEQIKIRLVNLHDENFTTKGT